MYICTTLVIWLLLNKFTKQKKPKNAFCFSLGLSYNISQIFVTVNSTF